jgi:hypothetical protein
MPLTPTPFMESETNGSNPGPGGGFHGRVFRNRHDKGAHRGAIGDRLLRQLWCLLKTEHCSILPSRTPAALSYHVKTFLCRADPESSLTPPR